MASAAERWADSLAAWAIPREILEQAPESPWHFPVSLFARSAQRAIEDGQPTPSRSRAREAVPQAGVVVDVGAGGGAAGLPLSPPAGLVIAVDESEDMLEAFAEQAERRRIPHREILGRWPDVAAEVPVADVVVCHHVFYNVADLPAFAAALTAHARVRVVVELTATHPQSRLNPLWRAVHGLERPTSPTADDAVAVLAEMGLDVQSERFERGPLWDEVDRPEVVAFTRRRLCVGAERDAEIDGLLGEAWEQPLREVVALWWRGGGPPA